MGSYFCLCAPCPAFLRWFGLCANGAYAGELSRAPLPTKLGTGLFVGATFTLLGVVPVWAMDSDIEKLVAGCKTWGDAVRDMTRGTWDLPLQQGSEGEEETPSKGKVHTCPTALQSWKR